MICKGSDWLCRITRVFTVARDKPVATAVCAGFADHRAELRLLPEVPSLGMTIRTLRTGKFAGFPSRVSKVGVYEPLLSRVAHATSQSRGDKARPITTPPTQSTGCGRGAAPSGGCTSARDARAIQQTRGARLPPAALGLPRRDGAVARVALHGAVLPGCARQSPLTNSKRGSTDPQLVSLTTVRSTSLRHLC